MSEGNKYHGRTNGGPFSRAVEGFKANKMSRISACATLAEARLGVPVQGGVGGWGLFGATFETPQRPKILRRIVYCWGGGR